jgi:hypothetical protein
MFQVQKKKKKALLTTRCVIHLQAELAIAFI